MIVTMPNVGGPLIDAIDGIRFTSAGIAIPDVLVPLGVDALLDRFYNAVDYYRACALRDPLLTRAWIGGLIAIIKIRIL